MVTNKTLAVAILISTFPVLGYTQVKSGNLYRLISMCSSSNSVMVMGIDGDNDYAKAIIKPKDVTDNSEIFKIERVGSVYKLSAHHSGKVLDIVGGSKVNGADLIQYTFGNTSNQLFRISKSASGTYAFQNVNSGLMIDLTSERAITGNAFQQYSRNKSCAQQFKLENAIASVSPAPAPAPTPTPAPTPDPVGIFTLGNRPFSPSSSWNQSVSASANYTKLNWPKSTGYNYYVNWESYSPAVHVGNNTDPVVQVQIPYSWGWAAQTIPMRLPIGAGGAAGTDGEVIAIEGNTVHNCWQFKRTSITTGTCEAYGRTDLLTGSGWGTASPFLSAGIVAAGSSQFAGLLVQAETDAGEIKHALQISMEFSLQKPGAVGEAISSDGNSSTGISQEGERLAIPYGVTMPIGLSPLGQKVFRALQNYGAFNIDVAGVTTLRAQSNGYDQATIDGLRTDMEKLIPLLQRVN
jgi:hypothetical protein